MPLVFCVISQNLTGGTNGGVHVTDVTNASRTMLMNLQTEQWDKELLDFFNIPAAILPTIKSSAECYGKLVRKLYIISCLQGTLE